MFNLWYIYKILIGDKLSWFIIYITHEYLKAMHPIKICLVILDSSSVMSLMNFNTQKLNIQRHNAVGAQREFLSLIGIRSRICLSPVPLSFSAVCGRHEIIINTRLTEWYCALNWFVSVEAAEQWARTPRPMANTGKESGKGAETVGRTWERLPTQWRPSWRSDLRPPDCAPPTFRIRIRIRCFDCVLMLRAVSTIATLRHGAPRLSISFCLSAIL